MQKKKGSEASKKFELDHVLLRFCSSPKCEPTFYATNVRKNLIWSLSKKKAKKVISSIRKAGEFCSWYQPLNIVNLTSWLYFLSHVVIVWARVILLFVTVIDALTYNDIYARFCKEPKFWGKQGNICYFPAKSRSVWWKTVTSV